MGNRGVVRSLRRREQPHERWQGRGERAGGGGFERVRRAHERARGGAREGLVRALVGENGVNLGHPAGGGPMGGQSAAAQPQTTSHAATHHDFVRWTTPLLYTMYVYVQGQGCARVVLSQPKRGDRESAVRRPQCGGWTGHGSPTDAVDAVGRGLVVAWIHPYPLLMASLGVEPPRASPRAGLSLAGARLPSSPPRRIGHGRDGRRQRWCVLVHTWCSPPAAPGLALTAPPGGSSYRDAVGARDRGGDATPMAAGTLPTPPPLPFPFLFS